MTERVRRADQGDVAELVRLRALLFENLGGDFFNPPSADGSWRTALAEVLTEQVAADQPALPRLLVRRHRPSHGRQHPHGPDPTPR